MRGAIWLLASGLACAPAMVAAHALGPNGFTEVTLSDPPRTLPPVADEPAPVVQPAPADPAAIVPSEHVPGPARVEAPIHAEEPVRTGSVPELVLPAPPAASVVVGDADAVAGAIELKLADPKSIWLPRMPKKDREALAGYYESHAKRPLWIADGHWSPAGRAVIDRLERAGEDGLDPADYPIPATVPGAGVASPASLAEADLKLSVAASLYARDARGGRIEPSRISALVTPKLELPSPDAVLADLAANTDAGAALLRYNPAYPGYAALRRKLAEYRASRPAGVPSARRPQRPVLTTQAIASLDDLPATGMSSPAASPRLEGDLVANMERWRWLPKDVAPRYIAVNIPEFRLRIMEGERAVHETRVITGKPESPTPIFSGVVEYAVVNPSWFIPPSIMKKEFLPGLAADPSYAAKRGYEVVRRGNSISVRQPPGERNALGFIKFMFPNGHAVYLHDTPNRNLFSSARRAFSHGCVRVEQPFQLADELLGSAWSEARLRKLIGHGERTIWLPQKTPVHLGYFTTTVDEYGELRSFEDVYGYNRKTRIALGLGA